ncbi:MAG: SAM-dependent methyltransferase [Actinomycetota bacterium]
MSFESTMQTVMPWLTATEALAAFGADLRLREHGSAPPEIEAALDRVRDVAGLGDLAEIPAPQRAMIVGLVRLYLHQALDLLEHPGRAPGWSFTEPAILDGWGRGSAMVPALIASAHPELTSLTTFLDVGTGVGLLAVAAATVWPEARIVGIDTWQPSLDRAAANVAGAGLTDRITIRARSLAELDDVDTFDCVWLPSFFLGPDDLDAGVAIARRALRPGGWIVLGRNRPMPDPLSEAVATLRTVRNGGSVIDTADAVRLLDAAGCTDTHAAPSAGPVPLELVLGRRPA